MNHEKKLKEILDYFKENKDSLLVQAWADGKSTEYEFAGITCIDVHKDIEFGTNEHKVLLDATGEEILTIGKDVNLAIENAFDDQLEKLDKIYEDFQNEKPTVKEKSKQKPRKNKLR